MRARILLFGLLLGCGGSAAQPSPLSPYEVLVVGKTGGCGNVFAFRATADGTRFLTVRVDAKKAGLEPGGSKRFDVATHANVVVQVESYERPVEQPPYCSDRIDGDLKPEILKAEAGTIVVDLQPRTPPDSRFHATVRGRDLRFRASDGSHLFVATVTIDDVIVGWNPG
jgi:hypothetical protein